ncbi:MAG TPA: hypothetical protein VNL77_17395 [Roseiflexaceae bacterium]|nr:hypothetical protein [Roseiflexaceae bacterium]
MDPIALTALVLFVLLIAAWVVLPGAAATGVADQDRSPAGLTPARQNM